MSELKPIFDSEGERLYNARQAAKIVGGFSAETILRWARSGETSFGFDLDVRYAPLIHAPEGFRHDARTHRDTRLLIPEAKVFALRDIVRSIGREHPSVWTQEEMDRLRSTAQRYVENLAPKHLARPPRDLLP